MDDQDVSRISGKITEIETFTSENALNKDTELTRYQDQLKDVEKRIALLTDKINSYKEGVKNVWSTSYRIFRPLLTLHIVKTVS